MGDRLDRPIGIFDSGFGGLTVARALFDLLPAEDYVYIGDTGRYPYGSKPLEEVRGHAAELATSLVDDFDVKAIVVACNTATAAGLDGLRATLPVPIVDVVAPGAQALVQATKSGRVGVIGTVGTISSGAYRLAVADAAAACDRLVELHGAACPGFVEFVERGQTSGDEVMVLAERLLEPVRAAGIDTLLLGCTHYPFLARTISEVMGPGVVLVSSADETAFAARRQLGGAGLLRARSDGDAAPVVGTRRFLSSGDVDSFRDLGAQLLGPELDRTERWPLDRPDPPGPAAT
ncbi:MAG: glutamate racemase [Actinomycetota bacterium]